LPHKNHVNRQANRQLKQASLKALADLVKAYGSLIKSKQFENVLNESANLISDADLHLTHLALRLLEAIILADKESINIIKTKIYPQILTLVQSSVLQVGYYFSLFSLRATTYIPKKKKK